MACPPEPGAIFLFMQLEYVKFTETPSFVRRTAPVISDEKKEILLKGYNDYHNKLLTLSKCQHDEYLHRVSLWEKKECYCGAKLRYLSSYGFWGCTNYKNTLKHHITFQGINATIYPVSTAISAHWVTDIIQECDLRGTLAAKDVYNFFIQSGLDDLRLKYGYKSTEKNIMGLVKANGRSKEQESLARAYLENTFPKVLYQQCITYKEVDKKEAFCIPDFIVSSPDIVKVIDAKLDYANDDKMDKYLELVKFFMDTWGDKRILSGAHIMYDKSVSDYFQSRHELITIPDIEYLND